MLPLNIEQASNQLNIFSQFILICSLNIILQCCGANRASNSTCSGTQRLCSIQSCRLKMSRHTCWMLQLWLWHWVHRNGERSKVVTSPSPQQNPHPPHPYTLGGSVAAPVLQHTHIHTAEGDLTQGSRSGSRWGFRCDLCMDNRSLLSPLLNCPSQPLTGL